MKVIAITGGIASGKSAVAQALAEALLCPWCSCDQLVHRLLSAPEVVAEIEASFPGVVSVEGGLDRGALAGIVFSSSDRRLKLESIVHPRVLRAVEEWIAINATAAAMGVVEVPLLYEVDFPIKRDVDIVVACSERNQIRRLALRKTDSGRAVDRIGAQMPMAEKISRAQVVIWNDGSLGTLNRLVALAARGIHQKLQ